MCLPCLRILFQSRLFMLITLLMSYSLTLSFRYRIVTWGSPWFAGSVETIYYLPKSVPLQSSSLDLSFSARSSLATISMWHYRLKHPPLKIFQKYHSALSISFPGYRLCSFSCNSCNINKNHKLPFTKSSITSSSPLDVIFSNVWTSPVSSSDGFHYYVIFVDHFTKYIWFYPLRRKSDVHSTFVVFKQLVENYFTTTIKTLYTDNGGEFLVLQSFLTTHDITHLTTPPHTPEHNGYYEHRHQHIVETGLLLLHQASIPLTF